MCGLFLKTFKWIFMKEEVKINGSARYCYDWELEGGGAEGRKSKEALLMQNLRRVGFGPSLNTCPRWLPHLLQVTSVRIIPGLAINKRRLPPTVHPCVWLVEPIRTLGVGPGRWIRQRVKKETEKRSKLKLPTTKIESCNFPNSFFFVFF